MRPKDMSISAEPGEGDGRVGEVFAGAKGYKHHTKGSAMIGKLLVIGTLAVGFAALPAPAAVAHNTACFGQWLDVERGGTAHDDLRERFGVLPPRPLPHDDGDEPPDQLRLPVLQQRPPHVEGAGRADGDSCGVGAVREGQAICRVENTYHWG